MAQRANAGQKTRPASRRGFTELCSVQWEQVGITDSRHQERPCASPPSLFFTWTLPGE